EPSELSVKARTLPTRACGSLSLIRPILYIPTKKRMPVCHGAITINKYSRSRKWRTTNVHRGGIAGPTKAPVGWGQDDYGRLDIKAKCSAEVGCRENFAPMPERDPDLFQIGIRQIGEHREISVVLGKALSVLPDTELLEPVRNLLHRGRTP